MIKKIKNGFTLLEAIVAIFVLIVAISGSFTLINYVISSTPVTTSKLIASYMAQEGIELIRNIRDTNWLQATGVWDKGLSSECTGACQCIDANGCVVDYADTNQLDPILQAYTGQFLNIDANNLYGYSGGTSTKFQRQIIISPLSPDILNVSISIYWQDKGINYQINAQENLYNWR